MFLLGCVPLSCVPEADNSVQLPELMLLRGMHDHGCDDIFIIVTDMKRSEMDMATEYFKLVCGHTFGPTLKQSAEREIHYQRTPHPLLSSKSSLIV